MGEQWLINLLVVCQFSLLTRAWYISQDSSGTFTRCSCAIAIVFFCIMSTSWLRDRRTDRQRPSVQTAKCPTLWGRGIINDCFSVDIILVVVTGSRRDYSAQRRQRNARKCTDKDNATLLTAYH